MDEQHAGNRQRVQRPADGRGGREAEKVGERERGGVLEESDRGCEGVREVARLEREKDEKGSGRLERSKAALRLVEERTCLNEGVECHLLAHGTLAWKIATLASGTVTTVKQSESTYPIRSITLLSITV